jgi:hypothetical protein
VNRITRPAAVPVLIFAGLVVATFAAFFVTTRLKRSTPVIEQLTFRRSFSPNGDGRFDAALFGLRLRRSDEVTVSIVTRDGDDVRTLAEDVELSNHRRYRFRWDGRNDNGSRARDGEYHLRVGLRRQGRSVTSPRKLFLDTVAPRPVVRYVSPDSISPDGAGSANSATLRFAGPTRRTRLLVYRTDLARPRLVAAQDIPDGHTTARWDGQVGGHPAATGVYLMVVRAQDAAGNVGPVAVPPRRKQVRGHPGLMVTYLAARAPGPVAAGGIARFEVSADGRRYRWNVRRLGSRRVIDRGASRSRSIAARVPSGRSGVGVLTVRIGSRRYATPFAVRGEQRRRVLVVLPATSWQARNRVEENGDGYPDTLPEDRSVSTRRPFAGSGMPPGFVPDESGVLQFLDHARLRYDVTTDLALSRDGITEAAVERYTGILFPGPPRFLTYRVDSLLRTYLRGGGRLAWIGRGGFAYSVGSTGGRELVNPSPWPLPLLGERVGKTPGTVPVAVLRDQIQFFAGVPGSFGPFGAVEASQRMPRGTELLAAAGTAENRLAVVVYRRGQGVIARVGIDGFGRSLRTSPDAARIMRRLWVLLSR